MPNTENIRKWVDALRSGNYQQATGTLTKDGGYCCLGVACDISGLGTWEDPDEYEHDEWRPDAVYVVDGQRRADILPDAVRDWLGFTDGNPDVPLEGFGYGVTLAGLNDDYGYSFEEIADVVERQYLTGEVTV